MMGMQVGILFERTCILICSGPSLLLWGRKLS